jgi:hypothetical protein
MKIRLFQDLSDKLDHEIAWRKKDLFAIKSLVKTNDTDTYLRMSVPLIYAHWEGFVKNAVIYYYSYIRNQTHTFSEVNKGLQTLIIEKQLKANDSNFRKAQKTIDRINDVQNIKWPGDELLSTQSNLNYDVLCELLTKLGMDVSSFETRQKFINKILIERRNNVAHGSFIELCKTDIITMADECIQLIENVKVEVENHSLQKKYLKIA